MSQIGVGAMIGILSGNEDDAKRFAEAIGKTIQSVELRDDQLFFDFTDGTKIRLFDDGQSCCESRYMTTDDDLAAFANTELRGGELREGTSVEGEYDSCHDTQFLVIRTSGGEFTMETHVEHNGYYGGFWIRIAEVTP